MFKTNNTRRMANISLLAWLSISLLPISNIVINGEELKQTNNDNILTSEIISNSNILTSETNTVAAPTLSKETEDEIKNTLEKYFKHEIKSKERNTNGDIIINLSSGGSLTLIDDPTYMKDQSILQDPSESVEGVSYQGLYYDQDIKLLDKPFQTQDSAMIKFINIKDSFEVKLNNPEGNIDEFFARFPEGRISYTYNFNHDLGLTVEENKNVYLFAINVYHKFIDEKFEYLTPSHYQFVLYQVDK